MIETIIKDFIALWAVIDPIDPIGTIPVFVIATKGLTARAKVKVALKATVISAGILLFFIIGGQLVLDGLSIPLPAFQVAGGVVLFLFALTMIFGESKPETEISQAEASAKENDVAVFPLAVPSIASPGAMMTAVLLTDNSTYTFGEQAIITVVVGVVLFFTLLAMLFAGFLYKVLGRQGVSVISRVMGLILAAVAINSVLSGIKLYFGLS